MYCVLCKQSTPTKNKRKEVSVNGRNMIKGECADCGTRKTQFVSKSKPIPIPKKRQTGGLYNQNNKREFNDMDIIEDKKKKWTVDF